MRFWLLFAQTKSNVGLRWRRKSAEKKALSEKCCFCRTAKCKGFIYVTFLLALKSNQKSALKNYVLKNLLNVPLKKSRGTCASRNVITFDMVRSTNRKVVSFDTDYMALL